MYFEDIPEAKETNVSAFGDKPGIGYARYPDVTNKMYKAETRNIRDDKTELYSSVLNTFKSRCEKFMCDDQRDGKMQPQHNIADFLGNVIGATLDKMYQKHFNYKLQGSRDDHTKTNLREKLISADPVVKTIAQS